MYRFWILVTFGGEVTKIQEYYVIFVYILHGKMGKTEKIERKSHNYSDQNTQNQNTKIWDEYECAYELFPMYVLNSQFTSLLFSNWMSVGLWTWLL